MEGGKPKPEWCNYCGTGDFPEEHWYWQKDQRYRHGGKWTCLTRKRAGNRRYREKHREKVQAKQREWLAGNVEYVRYKAYVQIDRKRQRDDTLSWNEAKPLMESPCHYCGVNPGGGLDRLDSSRGHSADNVVPCCRKCNNILSDLPEEAKQYLAPGLRQIREKGLFENWEIPQLRPAMESSGGQVVA